MQTVVLRLLDLETGELVADASFENPQRFGGSDVMSRILYDTNNGNGRVLMRTLAGYIAHAIEAFPVDPKSIYEVVVVGNSTMRDLLFRQSVYTIGQNPYRSVTEIELERHPKTTLEEANRLRRDLHDLFLVVQLFSYPGDYVKQAPTLERAAEILMKLEEDALGNQTAAPRGPRRGILRLGPPINVGELLATSGKPRLAIPALTAEMESRIQGLLDAIGSGRPIAADTLTTEPTEN